MELYNRIEHRRVARDSTVRHYMLAGVITFGRASPQHQTKMDRYWD